MTEAYLNGLVKSGHIVGFKVSAGGKGEKPVTGKPTHNTLKNEPIGLGHIKWVLQKRGIIFHTEHKFLSNRKFRFDVALLQFRLYVEYDGLMSKKSRHTTKTGFSKDQQKFNLAAANGWTGFRYSVLNYKDFENDLTEFLLNFK